MKNKKPLWKISIATTIEAEDIVTEMLSGFFSNPASSYFDLRKERPAAFPFSFSIKLLLISSEKSMKV